MPLGMHIGLATHQKVPKWAILRLIAHFYPLEHSYVGYVHPQWEPSCISSHWVLFVTLDKLHGVGDAHRLRVKPKMRQKDNEIFAVLEVFLGPFFNHLSSRM